jgi:dipeptidyl aminopeptidase/acylaminoacyl peptidase
MPACRHAVPARRRSSPTIPLPTSAVESDDRKREHDQLHHAILRVRTRTVATIAPTEGALIAAPVLLVHGDADMNVPLEQNQLMAGALRSFGRQVELLVVPGAGHGFTVPQLEIALPVVDAFLASRLTVR